MTERSNHGKIQVIESGFLSHIEHTLNLSAIDTELIKKRTFSVVIDAVNGAASLALPAILNALGCKVHLLNCIPDGYFPRGAEPLPHNLKGLSKAVIRKKRNI